MAKLKDTEIIGKLTVSEDIVLNGKSLAELIEQLQALINANNASNTEE